MALKDESFATVKRGPESWNYIYVALGFAIAIEATVIHMALHFPWNVGVFVLVGGFTFWLFIFNGWFQNKLIGIKNKYESKSR